MSNDVLTDARREKFECLGLDLIKTDLANGGRIHIGTGDIKEAAKLWVKEQENNRNKTEQQRHIDNLAATKEGIKFAKAAYWISIFSLIVAIIAIFKN